MKPIVNLALRSEFSFRKTFGKINDVVSHHGGTNCIGVADLNNTFSHVLLEQECKKQNVKPIFGVRLEVIKDPRERERGICGPTYIFLAKNQEGFAELNRLVSDAWANFYYKPMIGWREVDNLSQNVFVISPNFETEGLRIDYLALTPSTPRMFLEFDIPKVYINDNFFTTPSERQIYQLITGSQKRGEEYFYKFETKRAFQHIMTAEEFYRIYKDVSAIENTHIIADQCNVEIPKAPMAKYNGKKNIDSECRKTAKAKNINLEKGEYAERYKKEIELIHEKDYADYFMIVADMVQKAKKTMFVGPARGSAAGSLVCYLLKITEVDPLEHGLVFERFIDVNRSDLPDIDIDFPDSDRGGVIKELFKTYGKENVCHISNINMYKERSALDDVGISLRIPKFEMEVLKDSIIPRMAGEDRADVSIKDTLETTEVGKEFVKKYPAVKFAEKLQGHATHAGKHAAGVIVCNDLITKFGGVNEREGSIMVDKKGAEYLNLLKIDVLGLRTLTILQECASMAGIDYRTLYELPLDDEKAFSMFHQMRLNGIFQFEGQAMQMLCQKMAVEDFNDIVTITSIARPGPLASGGAEKFSKRRTGKEKVEYTSDNRNFVSITKETQGILVYQEQVMQICRECGGMSWGDVSEIRKLVSKSKGQGAIEKYKIGFVKGCGKNGIPENEALLIWENILTFGSYGFNKSHAVSYGLISYWCAYMKAHHPLEFLVANLRHSRSEDSTINILRDAVENDGIEYEPVDPDKSGIQWEVINGKVVGGLTNIKGIAEKKAKEIVLARGGNRKWTPSMVHALLKPETPFDTLYPCRDKWGDIYENPRDYGLAFPPHFIKDIHQPGTFVTIGRIRKKEIKDSNEYNQLVKRGGKRHPEGQNLSLRLIIEDDTGQINCSINRFKYLEMNGPHLADSLIVDESWVIVRGNVQEGWRVIHLDNIFDLKELEK